MKQYNRIMLGRGGKFAKQCREEGYIGANFDIYQDLSNLKKIFKGLENIF